MTRYVRYFGWVALLPVGVWAQAPVPAGDGLQGTYYTGSDFGQQAVTRRDATIDFEWDGRKPMAGVTAEQFSVRWTGWLVPPITGRYILYISSDDGARLWLNDRQLLDDWQSQGLYFYQLAITLTAGQAYSLRLDYRQHVGPARVRLAWQPPAAPFTSRNRHHRVAAEAQVVVIPARYLFSIAPPPAPVPPIAGLLAPAEPSRQPAAPTSLLLAVQPAATGSARPRPRSYLSVMTSPPPAMPPPMPAAASRVAAVAERLAAGNSVTLRALYFEQGQASLLPAVQASLDTLAYALVSRPALRLEVQGHTDNQGDPAINQRLSRQRAEAVCTYLIAHGVVADRLRAVGYGSSRPVADNRQADQRPRNRRVVLKPLGR